MAIKTINEENLVAIATSIRNKNGLETTYKPSEMAAAIDAIQTGIEPTGEISIIENGTYDVTDYATATVSVAGGGGDLPAAEEVSF